MDLDKSSVLAAAESGNYQYLEECVRRENEIYVNERGANYSIGSNSMCINIDDDTLETRPLYSSTEQNENVLHLIFKRPRISNITSNREENSNVEGLNDNETLTKGTIKTYILNYMKSAEVLLHQFNNKQALSILNNQQDKQHWDVIATQ